MNNIRPVVQLLKHLHNGTTEKTISFSVIIVSVNSVSVEIVFVVNEIKGYAVHL